MRNLRKIRRKKDDNVRVARYKMSEYDRAVELCPAKQITLNRDNLAPAVIIYDLETAGFKREDDILQVRRLTGLFDSDCIFP